MKPYYQDNYVKLYCGDCARVLPQVRTHDLLLTDPPYGRSNGGAKYWGVAKAKLAVRGKGPDGYSYAPKFDSSYFEWDRLVAQELIELAISKALYSIIFGGNYYRLGPTSCWLVWDKENGRSKNSDCELAWTNLPIATRIVKHQWQGMVKLLHNEERYHPSQKPLNVILWAIEHSEFYGSILDPFCGSGTTLVAAKVKGVRGTGIEIEERYCEIAAKRLENLVPMPTS